MMTIDEIVRSIPDDVARQKLNDVLLAWRADTETAAKLLMRIRDLVQPSTDTLVASTWRNFEDAFRLHSTVLTPYELTRTFGLEAEFEASTYSRRKQMTDRLRVDCDFPDFELRALEDARRLAKLTLQQRKLHDAEQARKKRESEAQMQQFMQEQQGDAFTSTAQAESRASVPRKMLDCASRERERDFLQSRGVDLRSKGALAIEADDVEQAIQFARLLSHERNCDLFRGQRMDWNPVPGVLRLPNKEQLSKSRWERFKNWASREPLLDEISKDQKKLAAVGQHYGIPTYLVDFTRNPRVAAFFATSGDTSPAYARGCIYCLWSGGLDAAYHHSHSIMRYYEVFPLVERVEVDGLFRMHAQEGSFVYANQASWASDYRMDIIRFPHTQPVETPMNRDIYPLIQSDMEQLVSAYFESEADWVKTMES